MGSGSQNEESSSSLSLELVVDRGQAEEAATDRPQDNMYDYDPETVKDKPWLKPGANISDYFNYGFTERMWMKYCEAQRENREWSARQGRYERDNGRDRHSRDRKRMEDDNYNRRHGWHR